MTMTMAERVYRTRDKSGWGAGPWQDEPDKVQFRDAATGLDCLIVRGPGGALCGYVGVSETHPWFRKGYSECLDNCGESWCEHSPGSRIGVHGGLTFADSCREGDDESVGVCHVPELGQPDHVWWFGFDCAHGGDMAPKYAGEWRRRGFDDGELYRDIAYVRSEIAKLAKQLAKAASR
jgi:hypothetical protein